MNINHLRFLSKNYCILSIVVLISIVGFYKFNDAEKINSEESSQNNHKNGSGVVSNTIEKMVDKSNPSEKWGVSPFGNSAPSQEEEKEGREFRKPNPDWKTKTINGFVYVFGEGNPKEFAMTTDELAVFWDAGGSTYMTPEAELLMKDFISSDSLRVLTDKCGEAFKYPQKSDMADILYVDESSGRKEFQKEFLSEIEVLFSEFDDSVINPIPTWSRCLTQDEFNEVFIPLKNKYLESTWNYRLRDPKFN